jgi:catechol 2,3-dioxygenase-like lactoylglutathione lyase family enzyme
MSSNLYGAAFDCRDAAAVARFWAEALGRQVADNATEQDAVVLAGDPSAGPQLAFHRVPEPKTVKNRVHLDLITTDFEAETKRLISLGAHKIRDLEGDGARWTTFADIEGNDFDLIAG